MTHPIRTADEAYSAAHERACDRYARRVRAWAETDSGTLTSARLASLMYEAERTVARLDAMAAWLAEPSAEGWASRNPLYVARTTHTVRPMVSGGTPR